MKNWLILRIYKTPEKDMKEFDLICKYRYVYFDYKNNYISSAGVPVNYDKKEFVNNILKNNKHTFKRVNRPLF